MAGASESAATQRNDKQPLLTARVQGLVSGRRGQIFGYYAKPDWPDWDVVSAHLPQSELHDLIVELRSLRLGVGSFAHRFDDMQELTGRPAEKVFASRAVDAAQSGPSRKRDLAVAAAIPTCGSRRTRGCGDADSA